MPKQAEKRKLIDIVNELLPGTKVRVRFPDWSERNGTPRWSSTLSDAQLIAYSEREVDSMTYVPEEDTCYIVLVVPEPSEEVEP